MKKKKLKKSKNKVKVKYRKKIKNSKKKVKQNKIKKKNNLKKKKVKNYKKIKKVSISKLKKKENFILKLINFQNSLKPQFKFSLNLNFEKYIQGFFDKIANTIDQYKIIKKDEARRIKLEKQEKERLEKIKKAEEKQKQEDLKFKLKEQTLKEEIKLEKQRTKDIKLFLRKEQALLRIEQAEKQKQFLQKLKLDKQIEKFRVREIKELEKLEKISLKEKRDDYAGLQQRIEKLKEKYRIIRDQKIRERVEALGVKIQGNEDRETLLRKEKEYTIARQKIEFSLESFYSFHPGGNLGNKLKKIKSIMHCEPKIPLIHEDELMSEAIIIMTQKGFGVVGIINQKKELIGIITDGDLRRNMTNLLKLKAKQVMTKNPVVLNENTLVIKALDKMEKLKITSIFCFSENKPLKPVGIIHIHDCLRLNL